MSDNGNNSLISAMRDKYGIKTIPKAASENSRVHRNEARKDIDEWQCTNCGRVLGLLTEGKSVLHIKHKDFYVDILGEGAVVVTRCLKCGIHQDMGPTQSD